MTAKGKINASNVTAGDRIIVKARFDAEGHERITESATKTGEGVFIARVIGKTFRAAGQYEARGKYIVETTAGSFEAAPIQTMWLAPEDAAGVKRAHAEALAENVGRKVAMPHPFRKHAPAPVEIEAQEDEELTLTSHAGKVGLNSKNETGEPDMTSTDTETPITRELTGSAVVRLLERVHERIRQNHPEVPEVVIVTGAGIVFGGGKWGHFRPQGWTSQDSEGNATHVHEMFMAGETLAKGARQVLQTMLHESAHALAEHRGEKDTSRQGRWHNQVFLKTAKELGLEYKGTTGDKTLGFSNVTLTEETLVEYKDLLEDLDREISLTVRLPGWMGGPDRDEDQGGENMGKAPKGPASASSNVKLTCQCEEPNIIRASKKVAAKMIVRCDDCEAPFVERD